MARLTAAEFDDLIRTLVSVRGLAKLQEQLRKFNAVVSRRRLGSAEALSRQLYPLTAGLERDGTATRVVFALWEEFLSSKMDEAASKRLDELAEKVNACLTPEMGVDSERIGELRQALSEYRGALGSHVGDDAARLTMISRAVPDVARLLREG